VLLKKKTIVDHLSVLFGSSVARSISFLNNIIIARELGVYDYGKFSLFYITMLMIWMIPQAFDATFIRYAKNSDAQYSRDEFFRAVLQLKLGFLFVMLIVVSPAIHFFSQYQFVGKDIGMLLFFGVLCGASMCFISTISTVFQEREQFAYYSIVQGSYTLIILAALCAGVFVFKGLTLGRVLTVYGVVATTVGAVCLLISLRMVPHPLRMDRKLINKIVGFGKWVLGTSIIFYIFPRVDIFILARYVDFAQIGAYSVAIQFTMVVTVVTGAMSVVYMPKSMVAVRDSRSFKEYIKECILPVLLIVAVILVLITLSTPLILLIYGENYVHASPSLRILLVGYILMSLYLPLSYVFYAIDRPQVRFYLEGFKLLTVIAALMVLVPRYNIIGAAMSVSLVLCLSSTISILVLCRIILLKLRKNKRADNSQCVIKKSKNIHNKRMII
jgi:O-antigen/teichoic acid export membrane protein